MAVRHAAISTEPTLPDEVITSSEELLAQHAALGERLLRFGMHHADGAYRALYVAHKEACAERDAADSARRTLSQRLEEETHTTERLGAQLELMGSKMHAAALEAEQKWTLMESRYKEQMHGLEAKLAEETMRGRAEVAAVALEAEQRQTVVNSRYKEQVHALEAKLAAESMRVRAEVSAAAHAQLSGEMQERLRAQMRSEALSAQLSAQTSQLNTQATRLQQLEADLRARDLQFNVSATIGTRMEEDAVRFLSECLGVMAEVTRTHAKHCCDIWVRFREDDTVIMIDAKNSREGGTVEPATTFLPRNDRNKFFEDIQNNPHVHGAILFSTKRVHVTNSVDRHSPTVLLVGGGNAHDLLRAVLEVVVAARLQRKLMEAKAEVEAEAKGQSGAASQLTPHATALNAHITNATSELLSELGQLYVTVMTALKEIATLADRCKARKKDQVIACMEKLSRLNSLAPTMVPPMVATQLQTGTHVSTIQQALTGEAAKRARTSL